MSTNPLIKYYREVKLNQAPREKAKAAEQQMLPDPSLLTLTLGLLKQAMQWHRPHASLHYHECKWQFKFS